jgi:nucleoside-diphosphate kinase
MHREYSVVLIKPDGVKRGLSGEIISRFEKIGLSLIACKLIWVEEEFATKHYGYDENWFVNTGKKALDFYQEHGLDPQESVGTMEPREMGKFIQGLNVEYLTEGPVLAMIWQGPHSVEIIRKLVGPTYPQVAPPGTITGDYIFDSPLFSNTNKKPLRNLVHASASVEEAKIERELWFKEKEIFGTKK